MNAKKRQSSRRAFLSGQAATEALGDLTHGTSEADSSSNAPGPPNTYLIHVACDAMACEFELFLNAGQHGHAAEVAVEALELVAGLEDQMTVFRDDSEVQLINYQAANGPMEVEPRLFQLFQTAFELYETTKGAFDITAGPLTKTWGFFRRDGRLPSQTDIDETLESVGSQHLLLDESSRSIQFTSDGIEINLGAIGKGYAVDRCGELLQAEGIDDYLIHGGQSSVLARGQRLDGTDRPGWSVGVNHPLRPDLRIAEIRLGDRALGTSGSGTQHFYHQGKTYGHIIDPRSGWPGEEVLSTTVLAPDAATADALATAFFVMGVEATMEYCRTRSELAAVLICEGKRRGALEIHQIGLQPGEWNELGESHVQ